MQTFDPVTEALTGHLSFNLLLAAILTWPIARGLLWLYTRAVRRSMASATPARLEIGSPPPAEGPVTSPDGPPGVHAALHDLPETASSPEAAALFARLRTRPAHAALVYAVAGAAYGVVMTTAQLVSARMEILPVRFLFLFWIAVWPVVLSVDIVAVSTRVARVALTSAYCAVLIAVGAVGIYRSPTFTWGQLFMAWILIDLPPTVLLLTYLSRGIRAVGPLILTFLVLALTGSDVAVSLGGSRDSYLYAILGVTGAVGLGGTGTFVVMLATGFLIFAGVGWLALGWIRRRYQAKRIGDESVTVDAIWMLFAVVHSVDLVFENPLWILSGFVGFAAYKTCAHLGFWWLRTRYALAPKRPVLLVLRSFALGRESERLFDVLNRFWRRAGSIEMIAGVDLASRTVEPHEFLDFISGKLARRFIKGSAELEQRMRERDTQPDRDLRFRVNDFFCYADTWKMVLSRLVHESDAVLMDLRGFSRQNAGCIYEIHELTRLVPLERVVFIVDGRTDEALLAETVGNCRAGVYRFASLNGQRVRGLMQSLAAAATSTSAVAAVSQ